MFLSLEVLEQTLINLIKADYETNQHNQCISNSVESIDYFQRMIMYQSILSPDDPREFARSHCLGVRDFESEKFSAVFKDKCRSFSICFKETGGSLKSRCSSAVSCQLLQKR